MTENSSGQMKRLYRSQSERMLGGVCGGLGAYLGIDPTLIRLVFVAALLLFGHGLLLYLILWLVVPLEPLGQPVPVRAPAPAEAGIADRPKTDVKG